MTTVEDELKEYESSFVEIETAVNKIISTKIKELLPEKYHNDYTHIGILYRIICKSLAAASLKNPQQFIDRFCEDLKNDVNKIKVVPKNKH